MMEFEGQNNDFGGTKRYNNIPLVPPNSFGPPTMVAVVPDFKDRAQLDLRLWAVVLEKKTTAPLPE